LGLGVYMTILSGWSSKSKYSLIGSIRSIAITLRYEICMAIVFLSPVLLINSVGFEYINRALFE
jgi:NADH:ubiquinone oxidoreductase subunit H